MRLMHIGCHSGTGSMPIGRRTTTAASRYHARAQAATRGNEPPEGDESTLRAPHENSFLDLSIVMSSGENSEDWLRASGFVASVRASCRRAKTSARHQELKLTCARNACHRAIHAIHVIPCQAVSGRFA